ncbi:mechanosensitive ion channel family protein [Waterburya agarophytonicola K14]|uniref:Mechanosensitive ion channel family protein n=1 Tax=Waterburya agarophytonicola KI4 TaxID=2874699 RepID=A0A964BNG1_9CYAN|nr:mechanosensitive ion channel family protein [Waterburya agarophytonicola]MCC0175568.1 mechanosensitive ion channel family protein [Waterburya agarophytonicola KI4]
MALVIMSNKGFISWIVIGALAFATVFVLPVRAQLPFLPKISLETFKLNQNQDQALVSGCVRLDGLCIFQMLDQKANLAPRIKFTEERLKDISQSYFASDDSEVTVSRQATGTQESIYVIVGNRRVPVLTMNERDAVRRGVYLEHEAERVAQQIERGLREAKTQRQKPFLLRQGKIAGGIFLSMILGSLLNSRFLRRSQRKKIEIREDINQTISSELDRRKKINLQEVKYRLLQFIQVIIWAVGIILILGLFPYTRTTQLWIITIVRIPLRIALVTLITYLLIRLSYALIAKINSVFSSNAIENNYVFSPEVNRRLGLRINTISRLSKGIVTLVWICIGIFVALSIIGFNIAPLLAGAGILGLAFSFASQSLIKDALNGFLIILEDQYAVGDIVTIGTSGGMVENLNLRITQLRDAEGRLITIANSQINDVANHSNGWSRSDIRIAVAYQIDLNKAIEIIEAIAVEIWEDSDWRNNILESPQILGVEDFSERGVVIRLWFKTEPLKQWEVAREFRRRIKIAFEQADIPLPLPQQQVWFQEDVFSHSGKKNQGNIQH